MKLLAWIFGMAVAVVFHAGVLAFGGIFFLNKDADDASVQPVDLLSDLDAEKEDEKPEEEPQEQPADEMKADEEAPPDGAELLKSLDQPVIDDGPALEAASLSAIEAALNGASGSGDFGAALSFESGGRIGATGTGAFTEQKMEEAFSLAELDQKPRAIHQGSPSYPSEMRGKKVEGVVTVIFIVDATGKVENARAGSSSHVAFEAPAVAAVKKWKFEPGMRGGERVASRMRIQIQFPQE